MTKEIRKLLLRLPEARQGDTYSLRGTVAQLLDDADTALDGRHEIIHSVCPNPSFDEAFSWRSLPKSKRDESGAVTWARTTSGEAFEKVIQEMVRIIDAIGQLLSQIDFEKVRRRDQQ